jgi:mRNA interferase HigB
MGKQRRCEAALRDGNDYRLVVSADFEKGIVWIKWLGTHKAYDRIDVKEIEHGN